MVIAVQVNTSDWLPLHTAGYAAGMWLTNKVGPAIEYNLGATSNYTLPSGSSVQLFGRYLWVRGAGGIELITELERTQRASLPEPAVRVLYNSGYPRIIVPSGIANATGTITFNAPVLAGGSGPIMAYLPAGVVVGDAVGGWYSGTLSGGTTFVLSSPTATVAGAYTQTGAILTLLSVTIPAGELGIHGGVRVTQMYQCTGSANTKVAQSRFGTQVFGANTIFGGNQTSQNLINTVRNCGQTNRQTFNNVVPDTGAGTSAAGLSSQDTTQPVSVVFVGQLNAAAIAANEWLGLSGCTVEIIPGANV